MYKTNNPTWDALVNTIYFVQEIASYYGVHVPCKKNFSSELLRYIFNETNILILDILTFMKHFQKTKWTESSLIENQIECNQLR